VAFDGKQFIVAWEDFRNANESPEGKLAKGPLTYEMFGTAVTLDGKVANPSGISLMSSATFEWPSIAVVAPGKSLVSSEFATVIFSGRTSPGKKSVKRYGRKTVRGGKITTPEIASDGNSVLMACCSWRPIGRGGKGSGSAYMLDANGVVVKKGILISKDKSPLFRPDVAWDGKAYVVSWTMVEGGTYARRSGNKSAEDKQWEQVYVSRLDKDGKILDDKLDVAGSFSAPARLSVIAANGQGLSLIAFEQHPDSSTQMIQIGARILSTK
jgi:hypothetical protein